MHRCLDFAFLLVVFPLIGCSGGGEGGTTVDVYPVSGTVTMFGSALANATVAFAPENPGEKQPTAVGTTDAQGNFQLTTYEFGDGAAAGNYKVIISKSSAPSSASSVSEGGHEVSSVSHGEAAKAGSAAGLVPAQYTTAADTPLTAEVKSSGENTFTFEIK